jgi:O-antigen ligase
MLSYSFFNIFHITVASYLLQGGLPILCSAFLIYFNPRDSVRWNSYEKSYLVFLIYFLGVALFDDYFIGIILTKFLGILFYFGVGWSTARYAVQNNQVERLMKVLTWFAIPFLLTLYKGNYFNQDLSMGERLGGDEYGMLNSNIVGLMATAALMAPLIVVVLLKSSIVLNIVSCTALGMGCYILIGSGSRNAFGAFAGACLVAIVLSSRKWKSIAIVITIGIGLVIYTSGLFTSSEDIRVLDLSVDSFRSSRFQMYEYIFYGTSSEQYLFGARSYIDRDINTGRAWGNAHSMYVQIAYEAGLMGLLLFIFYLMRHVRRAWLHKYYGKIALVFLTASLLSGLSESYPLRAFSITSLLWGMSVGILNVLPKREGIRPSGLT